MDEATKFLMAQGVLGVVALALAAACRRLWIENKSLTDRLEAKADKHAELNQMVAREITQAFETAMKSASETRALRRRSTQARPSVDNE